MSTLFRALGIRKTLKLFTCLLGESKVVLVSKHYTLLTIASETLTQLMEPFQWHHIYIPILPAGLLGFLEAPTPFIVGVHADYRPCMDDLEEVTVVDLDSGKIKNGGHPALLPTAMLVRLEEKLQRILDPQLVDMDMAFPFPLTDSSLGVTYGKCAMAPERGDQMVNAQLKMAFLEEWICLFKDYAGYVSFIRKFPEPVTIFNKERFIKDNQEASVFLIAFFDTQAFAMFLETHNGRVDSPFERINRERKCGVSHNEVLDPALLLDPVLLPLPATLYPSDLAPFSPSGYSMGPFESALFLKLQDAKISQCHVPSPNHESLKSFEISVSPKESVIEGESKQVQEKALGADGPFIEECLRLVLSEQPLSYDRAGYFESVLQLEPARLLFATALKRESKRLGLAELQRTSFEQLVAFSRGFLEKAQEHNDYSSPTIFLSVTRFFKVKGEEEFLDSRTNDLPIWQSKYFWEGAFFQSVSHERRQLPKEFLAGQPLAVPWSSLTNEEQSKLVMQEANLLFGVLGIFAHHMLNSGVSIEEASSFLLQMCRLCDIDFEQTNELQTLLKSMAQLNQNLSCETDTVIKEESTVAKGNPGLEYFVSSKRASNNSSFSRRLMEQQDLVHSREVRDGLNIRTLSGHKKGISAMDLQLPLLVSGSVDGQICLWNMQKASYSPFAFQAHSDRITGIILTKELLISASQDARVIVWSHKTGQIIHNLNSHTKAINSIHHRNGLLLSASDDTLVKGRKNTPAFRFIKSDLWKLGISPTALLQNSRDTKVQFCAFNGLMICNLLPVRRTKPSAYGTWRVAVACEHWKGITIGLRQFSPAQNWAC